MKRTSRLVARIPAVLAVALGLALAAPAAAQQSLGIAVVVNDEAITHKEVVERLALVLVLSGLEDTAENRRQLLPQVVGILINEKLQVQEGARRGLADFRIDRNGVYPVVEQSLGLPAGQLVRFMDENGLSLRTLDNQLTAEIVWGELVRYRQSLRPVHDEDVKDELRRMRSAAHESAYRLAEIFLGVDSPSAESGVREDMNRLVEALRSGARFSALARQFSQSASSRDGGDLGWIVESQLADELAAVVPSLGVGGLSPPVRMPGGFVIVLLLDVRSGFSLRDEDVEVTIRQVSFPAAGDGDIASVAGLAASVTSCDGLGNLVAGDRRPRVGDPVTVRLADLQKAVRDEVAGLETGRAGEPAATGDGVRFIVLCERVEHGLPTVEDARSNLLARQADVVARGYLRDLRRRAFVDIRI